LVQNGIAKLFKGDIEVATATAKLPTTTGQTRWFELRFSLIEKPPHGKPVILLNGSDITDSKKLEEQLHNELEFSKSIFNSTEAHYAIIDGSGQIIAVNEAWKKFGMQNGIVSDESKWGIGANYYTVCKNATDPSALEILEMIKSVQAGIHQYRETEYPCASPNEFRWFWMRVTQLESRPGHVLIAHVNISERKKSELALLEDKKIHSVLNKLMNDYVFKLSAQPNGQFHMSIIAGNYTEATGRVLDEARTNDQWIKIIHTDDRHIFNTKFKDVLNNKAPVNFECRSIGNDDSIRWLEIIAAPELDEDSNILAIYGSVRNITAKKTAEQEIKEGQEKYKNLIENLHAGVVVHNPDTSILFCNKEASLLLGLTEDQLKGKAAYDPDWYFTDEKGEKLEPQEYPVVKVLQTRQPVTNTTFGINRPITNDRIWVQVSAFPELDANQVLKHVVATFINITERKLAEEEIILKEKKYRNIFENVRDVYYEASLAGIILDLSPSIELATNGQFKNHELIGKPLSDFYVHPKDRERLINELFNHGSIIDFETQLKNKDGSEETISLTSTLVYDENNAPIKIIGSLRNISRRKQDEEKLRKSEERWRSIINTSPDGISIASLDGKIQFVTENLVRWHGYEQQDDLVGKMALDFVSPTHRALAGQRLSDMLNGTYSGTAEYELMRKDGSSFFVKS
jgi:PAS domain S-box-containing protein